MLGGMNSSAAIAPLVVLGVAGLGLVLVVLTAVLLKRPTVATRPASVDDLPGFFTRPPASPRAASRGGEVLLAPPGTPDALARPVVVPDPAAPPGDDGRSVVRFLLLLAALALALICAAAAAALPSARADRAAPPPSPVVVPHTDARLSFGGMVLEQQVVGATLTRPAASLSTSGRRTVLHLRLPTWNCLAPDLPDDPAAAGCISSVTQYGDLRSPALSTSSDGKVLVAHGQVRTYTRPNGSGPVATGRVYDLTLTVHPGRRLGVGQYVAVGVLTLGSGTARTDGDPLLNVLTRDR
jgi:hypothetical protein